MVHNSSLGGGNASSINMVAEVVGWVTLAVGLPVLCLVAYTLFHLVKKDQVTPVYVINLLITDIFNFIGRPQEGAQRSTFTSEVASLIFYYSIITNIVFMVCIAQERYLLVTRPLCLGHRHAVRSSTFVSLAVWAAPLAILSLAFYGYFLWFSICLLLPLPLFVFFCLDTCRVLSCSASLPGPEKRRVLATLTFILANYTLLFLPFILNILLKSLSFNVEQYHLETLSSMLLYLSPVVDPLLYICMRKDRRDCLRAFPCCRCLKPKQSTETIPTVSQSLASISTGTIPDIAQFIPTGSQTIPDFSKMIPAGSQTIPDFSKMIPAGSQTIPDFSKMIPTGSQTIPDFSKMIPAGSQSIPDFSKIIPAGSQTIPDFSKMIPAGSQTIPDFSKMIPTGSQTIPDFSKMIPAGSQSIPDFSKMIPAGSQSIPDFSKMIPAGSQTIPDFSKMIPTGSQTIPDFSKMIPTGSQTIPDFSKMIPTDSQTIPDFFKLNPAGSQTIPGFSQIIPTGSESIPDLSRIIQTGSQTFTSNETGTISTVSQTVSAVPYHSLQSLTSI